MSISKCLDGCRCGKHYSQAEDMLGLVSGRLTVIAKAETRNKRAYWVCRCECGNICQVMGKLIRRKMTQSCGCYKIERAKQNKPKNKLAPGEASFNQLLLIYKREARLRSIDWNLTTEEFRDYSKGVCFYCGIEPQQTFFRSARNGKLNGAYIYNGVDRQDALKGYNTDNCVPCCGVHNHMKKSMTVEQFIESCQAVVDYQKRKAQENLGLSLPRLVKAL